MARWALLRHDTPDGRWHYDWLLEPMSPPDAALVTFRIFARPDDPRVSEFAAERLADHRRVYLDYQGPVSGNRGTVTRLVSGECRILADGAVFEVVLIAPGSERIWRGEHEDAPEAGLLIFRASIQA